MFNHYSTLCFFSNTYLNNETEAEDIVQECFAKLWSRHTVMENPGAIKSFLYSTVRNACLNRIRDQKVVDRAMYELICREEIMNEEELNEVTRSEMIRHVFDVIHELPTRMQEAFRKYYLEGKNCNEIPVKFIPALQLFANRESQGINPVAGKLKIILAPIFFLLKYFNAANAHFMLPLCLRISGLSVTLTVWKKTMIIIKKT